MTIYKLKKTGPIMLSSVLALLLLGCTTEKNRENVIKKDNVKEKSNVIVFVWDGLRPDSVTEQNTPNLYKLMKEGVDFSDNHATYPTFTMMNASSFATGDFPDKTGFYGNTQWYPNVKGKDSDNNTYDFEQPVFTEDYKILQDINQAEPLMLIPTLFENAHKCGIKTAAVGKSGPAFLQDYKQDNGMNGIIFDEKHAYPLEFAKELQKEHWALPKASCYAYPKGTLTIKREDCPDETDNPTAATGVITMKDGVTTDPSVATKSPFDKANAYLMDTYLKKIIPRENPQLSLVWLRNPDSTEHNYGVNSKAHLDALHSQDQLLGKLITKLKENNIFYKTDIIVVSDHGHSNVSGPLSIFPLREITNGEVGKIDNVKGYSVSGDFRPADLLTRAGFNAYDGNGEEYDPILTGIMKDGKTVYQSSLSKTEAHLVDPYGHRDDIEVKNYTTPSYLVPKNMPSDSIIVANNGGCTYLYIPSHNKKLVKKVVRVLQSREEFGAVFVDNKYGQIAGTLPLSLVRLENPEVRNPDIIVGSTYDENAIVKGAKGIEFNSDGSDRGMHGSFSPIDVHNTLIAYGPDFRKNYVDTLPSGNIDVPTTIAYLLRIPLNNRDGRVLLEALKDGKTKDDYIVVNGIYSPTQVAEGLVMMGPTNPNGKDIDTNLTKYTIELKVKELLDGKNSHYYFDYAKAIRY